MIILPKKSCYGKLPPLRETVRRHQINARRSLGQHFLFDLNITRRITKIPGSLSGKTIIEIGSGPGALTRSILETNAKLVIAIERDQRCIKALNELQSFYPDRLLVVEADALSLDITKLNKNNDRSAIIANLPYNIAIELLIRWLKKRKKFSSMTLMFQKEVADRLIAAPGSPSYGRTSVITQWLCHVKIAFTIPARAFVPSPKINSAVVHLVPRKNPLAAANFYLLEKITKAAFGQRRKMLHSSLKSLVSEPDTLLELSGISPQARAETISVENFCKIATNYAKSLKSNVN